RATSTKPRGKGERVSISATAAFPAIDRPGARARIARRTANGRTWRMNRMVLLAAAMGASAALAGSAAGQSADWSLCARVTAGDWDRAIEACSRLVAAGKLKADERAAAYVHRGNSYLLKGDAERAIKDYDAALKLDPADVMALNGRGEAHSRRA